MTTFIVLTDDYELGNEIWTLQTDGVTIEEPLIKAEGFLKEITVYVGLAAVLIPFAKALFEMIKSKQKGAQKNTKTIVHTKESHVELKGLIAIYKESIYIEEVEEKD